jgi:hypothetical protein
MLRFIVLLAVAGAFASTASASPSTSIMIRHQVKGCHAWSIANGPYAASLQLTARPTTTLTFTDNDVMPHQLVQLSGPKATLVTPNMRKPGAHASVQLLGKGRYVFRTKAGEDYMPGMKTVGEDNVLRLVVIVP